MAGAGQDARAAQAASFGDGRLMADGSGRRLYNGATDESFAQCKGKAVAGAGNSVYRFFMPANGEHFLTASVDEGCATNYNVEGESFRLYDASSANAKPLYRCFMGPVAQGHSASLSADCEGGNNEGIYGYLLSQPAPGSVALYRVQFPQTRDALVTISDEEANSPGGTNKVLLGYVLPPISTTAKIAGQ